MIIMGLDLSTKSSGVSIFQNSKLIYSETVKASSRNVYNRIEKITDRIEEIVKWYEPKIVISEQPQPAFVKNNISVYRKLTFIHGAVCLMLNHYSLQMQLCSSSHWRKLVGIKNGRGIKREQLKEADIKKAKQLFPQTLITDDDVADAILIGYSYTQEQEQDYNWE